MLSVSKWVTAGCDALVAILLAPVCAACRAPLETPTRGVVCADCWRAIAPLTPPLCDACGDALPSWRLLDAGERRCARCRRLRTAITRTRAVGAYDGALRAIIHALKYDGRRSLARRLGVMMRTQGTDVLRGADVVVPVPLHRVRRLSRGFNQASDLARQLGVPVVHALSRTRNTGSQADLPAARRHANVRGAFRLARPARGSVKGACIVLVDDVSTTGATLEACARTLRDGGAREVRALIAARAVSRSP
jgi:ComF family protein